LHHCSWPYLDSKWSRHWNSHQYANHGTGNTVYSVSQLRNFGTIVEKTPHWCSGKQRLLTVDRYFINLSIQSGLPKMDMAPLGLNEIDTYPHVFFTVDLEWNPHNFVNEYTVHDLDLTDNDSQHNKYLADTINVYVELFPLHLNRKFN
jgi:hypothetical protein